MARHFGPAAPYQTPMNLMITSFVVMTVEVATR